MKLTLVLPGLIWPHADKQFFRELSLPSLAWLLGKASKIKSITGTCNDWLADATQSRDFPSAAYAASLLANPPTDSAGTWLFAHPIHLIPNRSELRIADAGQLGISLLEAEALVRGLNQHFAQDGMQFYVQTPDQWLLHVANEVTESFTPFETAVGRSMDPILPTGPNAMVWHRQMNEMQMLMYNHPVNDERDAKGMPVIHGVWLSSPGKSTQTASQPSSTQWWIDNVMWQGLAKQLNIPFSPSPSRSEMILESEKDALIKLETANWAQIRQDVWTWQEALREVEDVWFTPLAAALSSGKVSQLDLVLSDESETSTYRIQTSDKWKFWKRPLPLETLCS